MKRIVICLVLMLLFVGVANAQAKTMTGTVVDREVGNRWAAIVIKVGSKKYFVQTDSAASPSDIEQGNFLHMPKTVGKIDEVGRKVQVFYTKIVNSPGYDGELKATKIVEVKKSKSRKK